MDIETGVYVSVYSKKRGVCVTASCSECNIVPTKDDLTKIGKAIKQTIKKYSPEELIDSEDIFESMLVSLNLPCTVSGGWTVVVDLENYDDGEDDDNAFKDIFND